MCIPTKKYIWRFFYYYFLGYFLGMSSIFFLGSLLNTHLQDIPLIFILCIACGFMISHQIIKHESGFPSEVDCKKLVRKITLIAWLISSIPYVFYIGYCILIKALVSTSDIPFLLQEAGLSQESSVAKLLRMPILYLSITLLTIISVYYAIIRTTLWLTFKSVFKRTVKSSMKI